MRGAKQVPTDRVMERRSVAAVGKRGLKIRPRLAVKRRALKAATAGRGVKSQPLRIRTNCLHFEIFEGEAAHKQHAFRPGSLVAGHVVLVERGVAVVNLFGKATAFVAEDESREFGDTSPIVESEAKTEAPAAAEVPAGETAAQAAGDATPSESGAEAPSPVSADAEATPAEAAAAPTTPVENAPADETAPSTEAAAALKPPARPKKAAKVM